MAVQGERLIYDITVNSKGASQELKDFDKSVQQLNKSTQNISKTFDLFKGVLAGYLSFQGAKAFIELADAMLDTQGRLVALTGSMETAVAVQEELFKTAQKHSIAIKDLSKAYIQIAPVLAEQGKSQREILTFTDNVIAAYKLIGQSSSEAAQSVQNLAQAYASGKVDANQLTNILRSNREILKAVAADFGVSERALLSMAKSGRVSGEQLFQSIIKAGKEWQKEAAKLPVGIDEAMTNLGNSFAKVALQMAPLVQGIAEFILLISENFDAAIAAIIGITTALIAATAAQTSFNLAALANPYVLLAVAVAGAAYLVIKNWSKVRNFFIELFFRDIPNFVDHAKIKFLEFSQTFFGKIFNTITKGFQDFINGIINLYNKLAKKLNWKQISEVKFSFTAEEAVAEIEKVNKGIKARTNSVDNYIKSLNKADEAQKKVGKGLDTKGAKPPPEFGAGTVGESMEKTKLKLEDLTRQLKNLNTDNIWGGFKNGVQEAIAKVPTIAEGMNKIGEDLFNGMTESLTNFVKAGKLELKDLFTSISDALIKLGIQKAIVAGIPAIGFSKGGVFEGGKVTPFARGGIVDKPTIFPFASGIGLMGEKGAEAIMPLHRDSKGSLGVKAAGQSGNATVVNVYNQAKDTETKTEETVDSAGNKKIDVYITQKIKTAFQSGEMDRTMQTSFGLAGSGSR